MNSRDQATHGGPNIRGLSRSHVLKDELGHVIRTSDLEDLPSQLDELDNGATGSDMSECLIERRVCPASPSVAAHRYGRSRRRACQPSRTPAHSSSYWTRAFRSQREDLFAGSSRNFLDE
jgi:hypothetical protein